MVAEQQQGHSVADELATDPVARRAPLVRSTPMMNTAMRSDPHVRRPPSSAGLYDVLDLILDKGIVIDAFVRVSLVGIELLTIDLRVVIASVDTYLRYAEGAERLQLNERSESRSVPDMVGGKMKADTVKEGSKSLKEAITGDGSEDDDDDDDDGDKGSSSKSRGLMPALTGGMRKMLTKGVGRIVGRIADDDRYEDKEEADQGQERQERRPQQQNKGEEDRGGGGGGDRQDRGGGGQRHRHQSRNKPQPRRSKPRARR